MIPTSQFLEYYAYQLRIDSLRATTQAGSGHPTSCLSAADCIAVIFLYAMQAGDRFILSKGHAAPLLYAMYKQLGLISDTELLSLRKFGSPLEGHPTPHFKYVSVATGSLGQGLSAGLGMVLASHVTHKNHKIFVMMGDAELSEGSIWEAVRIAAHYKTNNLIGLVDANRWGQSTQSLEGHNIDQYLHEWNAFGWNALAVDGHSIKDLCNTFDTLPISDKPTVIIANTRKGYGLDANIEDHNGYHGKAFSQQELPELLQRLRARFPSAAAYKPSPHDIDCLNEKRALHDHIYHEEHKRYTCAAPTFELGKSIATRKAYGQSLAAAGAVVQTLIAFDGDVKNSTGAEIFEKAYPERFFQAFVAEQNMIGMATGAAVSDTIPFASTFAAFLTRAHDQLRMAAIGEIPLRIAGSHAGVSIGEDGPSQMGLEDIALMRTLPGSVILHPCDAVSTYKCVEMMINHHTSISYLRTLRGATPVIYNNHEKFEIGGCIVLHSSAHDVMCILATGVTVFEALSAYEELRKKNINVRVVDCYSIKPLPSDELRHHVRECHNRALTVEDHYIKGGFGEAVAYELRNAQAHCECLAVTKLPGSGTPEQLRAFEEIDAAAIIKTVLRMIS